MQNLDLQVLISTYSQQLVIILGAIFVLAFFLTLRKIKKMRAGIPTYEIQDGICLSIEVPKFNEKDALAAEQMFASLHGLLKYTPDIQEHISFEITASKDGIKFYAFVPEYFKDFVEGQIYAQYPAAEIRVIEDYSRDEDLGALKHSGCDMAFTKEHFFPIKTFRDFEVDPLAAITGAMEKIEEKGRVWMQILLRPLPDGWQDEGYDYIDRVRAGEKPPEPFISWIFGFITKEVAEFFSQILANIFDPSATGFVSGGEEKPSGGPKLSAGQEVALKAIEGKLAHLGFECGIRIVAFAEDEVSTQKEASSTVAALKQFSTSNLNSIERSEAVLDSKEILTNYQKRQFPEDLVSRFILNITELASIFHLPSKSVETPAIAWSMAKKGEPPLNLPIDDCVHFGKTVFRENDTLFGIKEADRRHHMYVIGKTGTGKSTLMKNMFIKDVRAGRGAAFVDPHGDAIEDLLDYIPEERVQDIVIFDPGDSEHPVALNMLEMFDPSQKNLYASGLLDVFKKFWEDISWGPRLEHILRNCILTLLEVPNTSLLGITRLLTDIDYQKYIVDLIKDPVTKDFWEGEIKGMRSNQRLYTDAIAPIQNKVGQFLAASTIRNIVGQAKSSIKVDDVINNGKILLINLSKGKIGEDNSAILGAMMISRLQFAAMARVKIPEEERKDFYVYVDEFQNFATSSFASILSEARKYRLNLILGHQYIAQLPDAVKEAIFGNIGTLLAFNVGPDDARFLAREFIPVFSEEDLINQKKYHAYLKLMIDGMSSAPFSAVTLPPDEEKNQNKEKAIEWSREKYSTNIEKVERRIKRWSETKFKKGMSLGLPKTEEKNDKKEDSEDSLPVQSVNQESGDKIEKAEDKSPKKEASKEQEEKKEKTDEKTESIGVKSRGLKGSGEIYTKPSTEKEKSSKAKPTPFSARKKD